MAEVPGTEGGVRDLPPHLGTGALVTGAPLLHPCSAVPGSGLSPPSWFQQCQGTAALGGPGVCWAGGAACPDVLALFLKEMGQSESERPAALATEPLTPQGSALVPPTQGSRREQRSRKGWMKDEVLRLGILSYWALKPMVTIGYHFSKHLT